SNAVTIWAFSSESDELPQVTVRPDSRTSAMASRLLAVIRSTLPRSLFGNAAATMAISGSGGLCPGSNTTGSAHTEHSAPLDDGNRERARPVADDARRLDRCQSCRSLGNRVQVLTSQG